ncbi:hypothetical protein J6590_005154 [Homalodisca vitripennis]|nr:hypothetical protein J6590_005154 [Homalodisca vitripennis]
MDKRVVVVRIKLAMNWRAGGLRHLLSLLHRLSQLRASTELIDIFLNRDCSTARLSDPPRRHHPQPEQERKDTRLLPLFCDPDDGQRTIELRRDRGVFTRPATQRWPSWRPALNFAPLPPLPDRSLSTPRARELPRGRSLTLSLLTSPGQSQIPLVDPQNLV